MISRDRTFKFLRDHLPERFQTDILKLDPERGFMTHEERLIWLLGDLMDGVENYYGRENPKRLGHINCAAMRIIDEVIVPMVRDERVKNVAASHKWDGPTIELEITTVPTCSICKDDASTDRFCPGASETPSGDGSQGSIKGS